MSEKSLSHAIRSGNYSLARNLLDDGADVNSALYDVINSGNVDNLKWLFKYGVDANYRIGGRTLLHMAVNSDEIEMVKVLLEKGVNVLEDNKVDGKIALHYAAQYGAATVFCLLDSCSNEVALRQIYTEDKKGKRPRDNGFYGYHPKPTSAKCAIDKRMTQLEAVFTFADSGDLNQVRRLFESDLEKPRPPVVNDRNQDGDTALHCASRSGQIDVVTYLLEMKADVLIANDRGRIALHCCARWNRLDVVRCLTSGHNIDKATIVRQLAVRDKDDRNAEDLAKNFGYCQLADYLRQQVIGISVNLPKLRSQTRNDGVNAVD